MKKLELSNLKLKTFTEQDAIDYCQLNSINPDDIIELNLNDNELTDISGIKIFKNLKNLFCRSNYLTEIKEDLNNIKNLNLENNSFKDYSFLKDLKKLEFLNIGNNYNSKERKLVSILKTIKNLKKLRCANMFVNNITEEINYIEIL